MKAASVNDLKKELKELSPAQLVELCVQLAKYKKDNKELMAYLLFDAHNKQDYVLQIKQEMESQFAEIDHGANLYFSKKTIRKILRQTLKYCRYLGDPALAAELHIFFCRQLLDSGIPFTKSQTLINLYEQELKRIHTFISALHPDIRHDFDNELAYIQHYN